MARQTMNPGNMSGLEMMNQYKQMSMASAMLKIGKSKRKYELKLTMKSKKLLGKLVSEMKKQMASQLREKQSEGIRQFLDYLILECQAKKGKGSTKKGAAKKVEIVKVSFEELDFLKTTIAGSLTEMDKMEFKWYAWIKKLFIRVTRTQYQQLLVELKK